MSSSKPYVGTEVSVEKTQSQIDTLLAEHRISDIRWTTTTSLKVLEFHHALREPTGAKCWGSDWSKCPEHPDRPPRKHKAHDVMKVRAVLGVRIVVGWDHDDRERKRLMRVLWWMLKSKFEIVDAGLVVFEEEFMPHLTLGMGRRMWDAFRPELERRIAEGHDLSAGIGETSMLRALPSGER